MMIRRFAAVMLALMLSAVPVMAQDESWADFDHLSPTDRALAEGALAERFGDNPELWPDWLEPVAVLIPVGRYRDVLIVREPMRLPCGSWGYTVFGPIPENGIRPPLGPRFCAGDLTIVPQGRNLPDLQFDSQGFTSDLVTWREEAARWRWSGTEWMRYSVMK